MSSIFVGLIFCGSSYPQIFDSMKILLYHYVDLQVYVQYCMKHVYTYLHVVYTHQTVIVDTHGSLQKKSLQTIARVLQSFVTHIYTREHLAELWAYYSRTLDGVIFQHLGVLFTCKAVAPGTHCYTLLGIHS